MSENKGNTVVCLSYETPSEAYLGVLRAVLERYQYVTEPRGYPCRETLDFYFKVRQPGSSPITTGDAERDKTLAKYTKAEKRLYLAGELSAEVWGNEASDFWKKIANPDGTINSNYGWLLFRNKSLPHEITPWKWAVESLKQDRCSRQAYARFSLPEHQWFGNKDQVCTMHMNFIIREEKLHATTVMRSNDVWRGLPYDMPWFCFLQESMAAELDVELGYYNHFTHSLHLYETDVVRAQKLLKGI